jgi:hypothetical protein
MSNSHPQLPSIFGSSLSKTKNGFFMNDGQNYSASTGGANAGNFTQKLAAFKEGLLADAKLNQSNENQHQKFN